MSEAALNPVACAVFIIAAFSLAGCVQTAWLAWPPSRRLNWPLDSGITFRGRRIFGANKTLRGLVVMIPATGASFMLLATALPETGRWSMPLATYGGVGVLAGLGFMLAELPNSFVKRQLDIQPGQAARGRFTGRVFSVVDHLDSGCGALAALAVVVPISVACLVFALAIGAVVHLGFSALTYQLGGKARIA